MPLYISAYIDPNADTAKILATDPIVVICFTMVIGFLTKRMQAFHAVVLGTLITSLAWILLIVHPSVWIAVATLVVVASVRSCNSRATTTTSRGSHLQDSKVRTWDSRSSRSASDRLSPAHSAGWLMHHFGEELHRPHSSGGRWSAVGVATTLLLWIYDRVVRVETHRHK